MMTDTKVIDDHKPSSPDSDFDDLYVDPTSLDVDELFPDDCRDSESCGKRFIAFSTIHNPPVKFKSPQRKVFIPNETIKVKILDYERSVTTHLLNPNLYTIQLTHGDCTWIIKKRYKHIQHLHQQLKLYRATMNLPFPTKSHREHRASFRNTMASSTEGGKKGKNALPRFPNKPEALVLYEDIDRRMQQLEEYLNNLLNIRLYRNHYETVMFLEVSQLSFIEDLGKKGKEGPILKRTGSTLPGQGKCNFCGLLDSNFCIRCKYMCSGFCGKWRNRWLFVKDTCLGYIRPTDGSIKCVLLFDAGFEVSSGLHTSTMNRGLEITNLSRQLSIKCWTRRKRKEWTTCLKEIANNEAQHFTQKNRYNSYAPVREAVQAAWFVDGCSYMAAVADALEGAQEEIFIADWWLSPEIYMKRPALGDTWRLDMILKRKAEQGVKIFVLLYKEVEVALGINSYYSKLRLAHAHKNIKVLRHPDHILFWAHHEKIVVVDQTYAFVGGIDLCYGRWDDYNHRLTDLGSVSQTLGPFLPTRHKQTSSRPLPDNTHPQSLLHLAVATNLVGWSALGGSHPCLYSLVPHGLRFQPISKVNSKSCSVCSESDRTSNATVETTEIAELHASVSAAAAAPEPAPVSNQVIVMNTDASNDVSPDMPAENEKCDTPKMQRRKIIDKVRETTESAKSIGREWIQWLYQSTEVDSSDEEEGELEKEDVMIVLPDTSNSEQVFKESRFVSEEAHHDDKNGQGIPNYHSSFHGSVTGLSGMAKLWIGKDYTNFIVKDFENLDSPYQDLVDRNTTPRMPWHDIGVIVQGTAGRDIARHFIQRWNAAKLEKAKLNSFYPYLLPKSYNNLNNIKPILLMPVKKVDCQVVRSLSQWSGGFLEDETFEEGIHEAYIDIITNAKHYIYIENQFFITKTSNTPVHNQIGEALFKRIMRAHRESAVFRVFVVLPLLPGFEGEVGSPKGKALHAITHWNYSSICRGKDALINKLVNAGVSEPSDYITFHGLRTHSCLNGDLVSELIYVHSKLLIADDNTVICGSANINDRSMLGKRDSEIAVILKDCEFEDSVMNGEQYQMGKFAGSLRCFLFREHLGLLDPYTSNEESVDIKDPVISSFYNDVWLKISTENTDIYEEVFHCLPSDKATSFNRIRKIQEKVPLGMSDPCKAAKMLEKVQGHLVSLPLDFLQSETLTPSATTVEGMLPTIVWT